jgi:hypothetical protein
MKYPLFPPLSLIQNDLFGGDEHIAQRPPAELAGETSDAPNMNMPDFLLELVQRRAASQAAFPAESPATGQIRRFSSIPEPQQQGRQLDRTFGVLLGASLGGRCWSGWIVAQEADYASDRDLILQEDDGPFSPDAAMVQTWNLVSVIVRGDEDILGKLSSQRQAVVRLLAERKADQNEFVTPRPGRIGAWDLDAQNAVVTGTPLGDETDPRHGYQQLYRMLATQVSAAAVKQASAAAEPLWQRLFGWMNQTFVRPAWTFGALAVLVAQGVWLAASSDLALDDGQTYRSASRLQAACEPRIRIMFKPDTPYADVAVLMRRVGATLVNGPSETGEVWVVLPAEQNMQEAANTLTQSQLVEAADIVSPDKKACRE